MDTRVTAARDELAAYPYSIEIPTRFGDMDQLGHINNVAFSRLFEEARVRFNLAFRDHQSFADMSEGTRIVLAASAFQYLREAHHPQPVMIGVGVSRIGKSSYVLAGGMFQNRQLVALNDATLVHAPDGKSAPLPGDLRRQLESHLLVGV